MNKEGLAADLVCLLDQENPQETAKFQEKIEQFFIAGAARIDLIAKVIDLDNEIGGNDFDITNLEETTKEIESLEHSTGNITSFFLVTLDYNRTALASFFSYDRFIII